MNAGVEPDVFPCKLARARAGDPHWPWPRFTGRRIAAVIDRDRIAGPQPYAKGLRRVFSVAAVTATGVSSPTIVAMPGHADILAAALYTVAVSIEAKAFLARILGGQAMSGLDMEAVRQAARRALAADPEILAVLLYGSRARGDARPDSDWDIALVTSRGQLQQSFKPPDGWGPVPNGTLLDVAHIPADELRRKADAIGHIALPIVREAVVLAGSWDRPAAGTPAMELEDYGWLMNEASRRTRHACKEIAQLSIPSQPTSEQDEVACTDFIVDSTLAARALAEAMLGRLGIIAPRKQAMEQLAPLFGAPELRAAVARLGGPAPVEDRWGLPRCHLEHVRAAIARIAGLVALLAEEIHVAAASERFASWPAETATIVRSQFEAFAAAMRAGEKKGASAGIPVSCPMIAAAVAARPELMRALERASARLAVLDRPTASDAMRQAFEDDMEARPGVWRRLAQ